MFIQTETTPNPQTLKFLPGRVVLEQGTAEFLDAEDAARRSPLAARLLGIDGVTGVFFGFDFITVTRDDTAWQHLKPAILAGIMEHFMSNQSVMADDAGHAPSGSDAGEEFYEPGELDQIVHRSAGLLGVELVEENNCRRDLFCFVKYFRNALLRLTVPL